MAAMEVQDDVDKEPLADIEIEDVFISGDKVHLVSHTPNDDSSESEVLGESFENAKGMPATLEDALRKSSSMNLKECDALDADVLVGSHKSSPSEMEVSRNLRTSPSRKTIYGVECSDDHPLKDFDLISSPRRRFNAQGAEELKSLTQTFSDLLTTQTPPSPPEISSKLYSPDYVLEDITDSVVNEPNVSQNELDLSGNTTSNWKRRDADAFKTEYTEQKSGKEENVTKNTETVQELKSELSFQLLPLYKLKQQPVTATALVKSTSNPALSTSSNSVATLFSQSFSPPGSIMCSGGREVFVGHHEIISQFRLTASEDAIFRVSLFTSFPAPKRSSISQSFIFSKGSIVNDPPVSKIAYSPASELLFLLVGGELFVRKIKTMENEEKEFEESYQHIDVTEGRPIDAFDIQDEVDHVNICVTSRKRVYVLLLNLPITFKVEENKDPETITIPSLRALQLVLKTRQVLFVPESVKVCCWVGSWICLGFKTEYTIIDTITSEVMELHKLESKKKDMIPLIAVEGKTVVAVGIGENVLVCDVRRGVSKLKGYKISFEEVPRSICLCADYVIAVLTNHIQVKRWRPGKTGDLKKKLRMFPHAQLLEISDPRLVFEDSVRGHLFATSTTHLYYLQPLNLMLKVRDLKWVSQLEDKKNKDLLKHLVFNHLEEILLDRMHPFGHSFRIFTGNFKRIFAISPHRDDKLIHEMFKSVKKYLREKKDMICKVWDVFKNEELQEFLEQCLHSVLFDATYDLVMENMHISFAEEIERFHSKQVSHKELDILGINASSSESDEILDLIQNFASSLLNKIMLMISLRSTFTKFSLFGDMHDDITECFEKLVKIRASRESGSQDPSKRFAITADEVLSLFIHVALQCPKELPVHLTFLFEFLPANAFSGKSGFNLTSLQLAVQYIQNNLQ